VRAGQLGKETLHRLSTASNIRVNFRFFAELFDNAGWNIVYVRIKSLIVIKICCQPKLLQVRVRWGLWVADSTTNLCYLINVQCFILLEKCVCQLEIVSIYLA